MALKRLTVQEMFQLSTPWTTPNDPARVALEKVPLLAALLGPLEAAHKGVFTEQLGQEDPRARALTQASADADALHDSLVRGIYGALTTLAELSPSADELIRLRDMLLPEGLEHTRKTFRGEAGHAAMVASRLDETVRARLKAITLHDKNLLDLVDAWLASAQKLGQLEDERARLTAPSSSQVTQARFAWVRVANALVANAELAGVDEATDRLLFAALRAAEKTADARRRGKVAPVEPPKAPGSSDGTAGSAGAGTTGALNGQGMATKPSAT